MVFPIKGEPRNGEIALIHVLYVLLIPLLVSYLRFPNFGGKVSGLIPLLGIRSLPPSLPPPHSTFSDSPEKNSRGLSNNNISLRSYTFRPLRSNRTLQILRSSCTVIGTYLHSLLSICSSIIWQNYVQL